MKVILLQDMQGVGKRHEVKEVRDGYAVNFLIAKKIAVRATPHELARRDARVQKTQEEIRRLQHHAQQIKKETLSCALKTGAHGEVFNSITANDIKKILEETEYKGIKEILLEKPIRTRGVHKGIVHFKHGIQAAITIEAH